MRYIALLRGINVGGHKKIKMADLRVLFDNLGYDDIKTYIQSGNVIFKSEIRDNGIIEDQINTAILNHFGFEVPVIVINGADVKGIISDNPFTDPDDIKANKVYFVVFKERPAQQALDTLSVMHFENEQLLVTTKCVYLKCDLGAGKAKCNTNVIEGSLKVSASSRNHRTMMKLSEMIND